MTDGGGMDGERAAPVELAEVLGLLAAALSDPEPDAAMESICELGRTLCGAEAAFFVPAEEGPDPSVVGCRGRFLVDPEPYRVPLLVAAQAADDVLRVDDLTLWAPTEASQRPYGTLADGRLPRSWLGVPVRSRRGERLGTLLLCSPLVRSFGPAAERMAGALAGCIGAVMQVKRLVEERASVTQALESTLLPPILPTIEGMEVAARYRAGGTGNLVGGDFYDVFRAGGLWHVVIGDVTGFGPEAAAVTGIARYTVRAVAARAEGPAATLHALNEALVGRVPDDRFCTAVVLRVVEGDGFADITVANGGHPPPMILRDDGTVEPFEAAQGMLLGVTPSAFQCEGVLRLEPGDALVLYTDGVTEARDDTGRLFGGWRLRNLLASCAGRTADGVARRVELAVMDHQGGKAADDIAVLVLRVPPAHGRQ
ncbi:MAG TPA: GAF domain-containing SpoIIE family protein phosphatase [Acidimicrobiales bacterium]|nr:GAF domain-containing SpoIIE family protein phosphatase [Acidimicrobiales bacterium]